MDVFDAIRERQSVRRYTGEKIPKEDMRKLLTAAREAPSAKNLQPWRLIVITDRKRLSELVPICRNQGFVENAGALIVGITEEEKWAEIDLAIALDHLSLLATELGLGTCWIGAFHGEEMREKLGVPDEFDVTLCMTVGFPAESAGSTVKKNIEELVHWEEF